MPAHVSPFALLRAVREAMTGTGAVVTGRFDEDRAWIDAEAPRRDKLSRAAMRPALEAMDATGATAWARAFRRAWDGAEERR